MAFSQTDLDNVRTAIARGELTVEFADRRVTYRSVSELLQAEQRITQSLSAPRAKQTVAISSKGF